MNREEILQRVQELKQEAVEKDEVIRDQQIQIDELENKLQQAESRYVGLEQKIEEMSKSSEEAENLFEKLTEVLG
jgi:hypothetical protein